MEIYGLDVLIPDTDGIQQVHDIIYKELVRGLIKDESRRVYQRIIGDLAQQGAQGVILGCTEITMLIQPEDSPIPVFDTTALHALAAVEFALQ
jgi:aspartate racemase